MPLRLLSHKAILGLAGLSVTENFMNSEILLSLTRLDRQEFQFPADLESFSFLPILTHDFRPCPDTWK